jgi:hypothetical protein
MGSSDVHRWGAAVCNLLLESQPSDEQPQRAILALPAHIPRVPSPLIIAQQPHAVCWQSKATASNTTPCLLCPYTLKREAPMLLIKASHEGFSTIII